MSVITLPLSQLNSSPKYFSKLNVKRHVLPIARSIAQDGLLNPIRLKKIGQRLKVIDGKKRLIALKLLFKSGKLPRSLVNVPVIISDDETHSAADQPARSLYRPVLLSDAELKEAIVSAHKSGQSEQDIAERFECSLKTVTLALSLNQLHPQIADYFESGHLSLEQAAAFATLPRPEAQWRLLQELGPFAHAETVIAAILKGETVIEMPDGDMMIMPSQHIQPRVKREPAYSGEEPIYKIAA